MYENESQGLMPTTTGYDSPKSMQRVSIKKETELRIERIKDDLAVQEELLQLLNDNPVIQKFMDLSRGIR